MACQPFICLNPITQIRLNHCLKKLIHCAYLTQKYNRMHLETYSSYDQSPDTVLSLSYIYYQFIIIPGKTRNKKFNEYLSTTTVDSTIFIFANIKVLLKLWKLKFTNLSDFTVHVSLFLPEIVVLILFRTIFFLLPFFIENK